jgi:hypothetical protein
MNFQDSRSQLNEDKEEAGFEITKKYSITKIDKGKVKTEMLLNYNGKEKELPSYDIHVPLLDIIGYCNLDLISYKYGHFCVRVDTIPNDLHLQPQDRVQISLDPYNKGFNNTILIFYNLNIDIKKLGFTKLARKDAVKYGKTFKNPRYFYNVSGEEFYLDDSYESIYFNQKMINKFKESKGQIEEINDTKGDKMLAFLGFFKNLISWDYDEEEDKLTDDLNSAIYKIMLFAKESFKLHQKINIETKIINGLQKLFDENGYEINLSLMMENAPHLSDVALEYVSQKHMKTFSLGYLVQKGVELNSKSLGEYLSKTTKETEQSLGYKRDVYRLRFNEEFNTYNPLEDDPILTAELKGIFKDDFELFCNRRLAMTDFQKTKLTHLFRSLRSQIKDSNMDIEKMKKYDLFLRFICEMIKNSDTVKPHKSNSRFFNRLNYIYDDLLIKSMEYLSDDEEEEPMYIDSIATDYVEERRYYGT